VDIDRLIDGPDELIAQARHGDQSQLPARMHEDRGKVCIGKRTLLFLVVWRQSYRRRSQRATGFPPVSSGMAAAVPTTVLFGWGEKRQCPGTECRGTVLRTAQTISPETTAAAIWSCAGA